MTISIYMLTAVIHLRDVRYWLVCAEPDLYGSVVGIQAPQAELLDLDLHRIDDGEAAVRVLVGNHHPEAAFPCLRDDVAGWKKIGRSK